MDSDTSSDLNVNYLDNKGNNIKELHSILTNQKKISLRLIDWFATNYSKKNFYYFL